MAYRRKTYRPKKSYRKKKIFKKKRMMKRRNFASTGHSVKCNFTKEMTYGVWTSEPALQARIRVYWATVGVASVNNECHLSNSPEFQFWSNVYTKYKVTGCKMAWKPDQIYGGGTTTQYKDVHIGSFEDEAVTQNSTTVPEMMQKPDYATANLGNMYNKYVSVSKYVKRINGVMVPNVDQSMTLANTQFCGRTSGQANGAVVGAMHVTWFVKFYGPKNAN